jgi:hypothetical protein
MLRPATGPGSKPIPPEFRHARSATDRPGAGGVGMQAEDRAPAGIYAIAAES